MVSHRLPLTATSPAPNHVFNPQGQGEKEREIGSGGWANTSHASPLTHCLGLPVLAGPFPPGLTYTVSYTNAKERETGVQSTNHGSRVYLAPGPQRRRRAFSICCSSGGPREDPYSCQGLPYSTPNHFTVLAAFSLCFSPVRHRVSGRGGPAFPQSVENLTIAMPRTRRLQAWKSTRPPIDTNVPSSPPSALRRPADLSSPGRARTRPRSPLLGGEPCTTG